MPVSTDDINRLAALIKDNWSLCEFLGNSEAVAVAIQEPHERGYPQFAGMWHHWQVRMREIDKTEGYQYSIGISRFLEREQMERLFVEAGE